MSTAADTVLILRTCNADLTSYGGFKWPVIGHVEAPDWNPAPECGGGLHGLLWGEGSCGYLSDAPDARWLVFSALADEVVDSGDWGEVRIRFWDGRRFRTRVGYIGEDGLKPNTRYRLNGNAQFVEADKWK